jgi:HTH-type transcriptional regulator/antitoxin HigA
MEIMRSTLTIPPQTALPTLAIPSLVQAWHGLQSLVPLSAIHNEQQYDRALNILHKLLALVGNNESHPLYELLDTLGTLIHAYEESHYPAPSVTGIDVLRYLCSEHELTPKDLPELGPPNVVSELLAGKQELSVENIRALSQRFDLSPATFF